VSRRRRLVALTIALSIPAQAAEIGNDASANTVWMSSRFDLMRNYQALRLPVTSRCQQTDGDKQALQLPARTGSPAFKMLADSAPVQNENETELSGRVRLLTDSLILRAERLHQDRVKGITTAEGELSLETRDVFFSAASFRRYDNEQTIELEQSQFYFFGNGGRGQAEQVNIEAQSGLHLQQLTLTTCEGESPAWQLSASSLEVDRESGRGEAWHTVLRLGGVPVFYLPYLNFPMSDERKSGLLMPTISSGERNGLDYAQPIYWNIAPSWDATFTPRYIEKRGTELASQWRWLSKNSHGQIDMAWLGNDKQVQALTESAVNADLSGLSEDRWRLDFTAQVHASDRLSADFDLHRLSDFDYLRDLGGGIDIANQTAIESTGRVSFDAEQWQLQVLARHFQSLVGSEPYRLLPSIRAQGEQATDGGWRFGWQGEWSRFRHPDDTQTEADRWVFEPAISYRWQRPWAYIEPSLALLARQYRIIDEDSRYSDELAIASLDAAIFLERQIDWGKRKLTHSLSPRIFMVSIPDSEQASIPVLDTRLPDFDFSQLFRANRYLGYDRIAATRHVALSIENRWQDTQTGRQYLKLELGQKFYQRRQTLALDGSPLSLPATSPLLAGLEINPRQGLSLRSFIEFDARAEATHQGFTQIHFEPMDNHIVNLSHRYRNDELTKREEVDFSFAWPISSEWRITGRWYGDLVRRQSIESLIGVEYESCCWAIRLVGRRYLNSPLDANGQIISDQPQFDSGIQLQFVFKGLGSAGQNGISSLLQSSIEGYRDPLVN